MSPAVALAMEAIGDITASAELSRLPVVGEEFDSRIQGGLLVTTCSSLRPQIMADCLTNKGDGIGGFVSALFTVTPLSNFAQNNGVIAITRCANRTAGQFCYMFLILFGIFGKISGVFLASAYTCKPRCAMILNNNRICLLQSQTQFSAG